MQTLYVECQYHLFNFILFFKPHTRFFPFNSFLEMTGRFICKSITGLTFPKCRLYCIVSLHWPFFWNVGWSLEKIGLFIFFPGMGVFTIANFLLSGPGFINELHFQKFSEYLIRLTRTVLYFHSGKSFKFHVW